VTRNLSGKKKNDGESFAACEDLLVVFLLKVISFGILIFFFCGHFGQGAGKSAVLNSLIGHPVLVGHIWFEPHDNFYFYFMHFC
jgi:hypothetical protein